MTARAVYQTLPRDEHILLLFLFVLFVLLILVLLLLLVVVGVVSMGAGCFE